jgi:hypothetical protein
MFVGFGTTVNIATIIGGAAAFWLADVCQRAQEF